MTPLHAHAPNISVLYLQIIDQKASVEALVQVDFPVHALDLSTSKTNNQEKNG